jgi:hypothetical protein
VADIAVQHPGNNDGMCRSVACDKVRPGRVVSRVCREVEASESDDEIIVGEAIGARSAGETSEFLGGREHRKVRRYHADGCWTAIGLCALLEGLELHSYGSTDGGS